jgi:hypothetical protein
MQRNFNFNLKGFDGSDLQQQAPVPVLDKDGAPVFEDGKAKVEVGLAPIVCKDAVVMALCQPYPGEDLDADAKVRRANIAERVFNAKEVCEISMDEALIVKHCVGKAFAPIVVRAIVMFLEG